MTEAEDLMVNPTDELRGTCGALRATSDASRSESRTDLQFEDGSALVVTSRDGEECVLTVVRPPEPEASPGV